MPYYLAPYIGAGTISDPFRPRGSLPPGWSAIDLRPDGGATLGGGGLNACLVHLPVADPDPLLEQLADLPDEILSAATQVRLRSRLTLPTIPASSRFRDVALELLRTPPPNAWPALRPVIGGRFEVWLGGGLLASQMALEPGPLGILLAALGSSRSKVRRRAFLALAALGLLHLAGPRQAHAVALAENWNCANVASSLTCQLTWTEVEGTAWGIVGNQAQLSGNVGSQTARADSDLSTADHDVQCTLVTQTTGGGNVGAGPIGRKDATATLTFYLWTAESARNALYKRVAGTFTLLGNDAVAPVPTTIYKLRCNGSSMTGFLNGVAQVGPVTDTDIVGNLRGGIRGASDAAAGVIAVDDWSAADLAAAAPQRTLTGVGL